MCARSRRLLPPGVEEGYGSNPSRGRTSTEGRPHDEEGYGDRDEEEEEEERLDEEGEEEEEEEEEGDVDEQEEEEDNDDGRRHHGVGNGGGGGRGGGGGHGQHGHVYANHGDRTSRDQTDLERRAMAHAYADGLDGVAMPRDAPGGYPRDAGHGTPYSGDRHQRSMPPAPPGGSAGVNGISPVDARAATALAARTRLAAGGVAVPDRAGLQRPEPAPVLAPGQAALAAEAALRRGPTPGSHSLPSMVLVPLEALKAHRRVPRSSDRRYVWDDLGT